ncbi:MAG: CoA transferase [Anaerolineae bacterium]|nr:CoA transferase [Anaerolineae bacterium]
MSVEEQLETNLLALGDSDISGETVLPGPFAVADIAARCIAASHRQAALFAQQRGLAAGQVRITRRAAAAAFRSERYLTVNHAPPAEPWSPLSGYYETNDGWVQLHTNYDHHRDAVLRVTGAANDRASVAAALKPRSRFWVEQAVLAEGGCAFAYRSRQEWEATPQAAALDSLPLMTMTQVAAASPSPAPPLSGDRPLAGVRVLDLTHIIAGPVCARTLAAYGANVTRVLATHLPTLITADIDTGFGKTWQMLNLAQADDRAAFLALVRQADIVVQGFRPGAFDKLGVGPAQLCAERPGLVVLTLSAWSHVGPWAGYRGFDSLVQTATGIAHEGERAREQTAPCPLPAQAIDHATGYLMAAAAIHTLARQQREGGSWHVRASLAQTGHWLWQQPRISVAGGELGLTDVADLRMQTATPYGLVQHLAPVGEIAGMRLGWDLPPPLRPAE